MKNLVKKLFLPIAVSAALLFPTSVVAQEKKEEAFKPNIYFSLGTSFFWGNNQVMRDTYGAMMGLNTSVGMTISEHVALEGAFSYYTDEGKPKINYDGEGTVTDVQSEISITQFDGLLKYIFRMDSSRTWYMGAGIASVNVNEKASAVIRKEGFPFPSEEKISEDANASAIGISLVTGYDLCVGRNKNCKLYGNISYTAANADGVSLGGFSFGAGFKYFFK